MTAKMDSAAAAAALADIDRQHRFVTGRLAALARLYPLLGVVLAVAAISLLYRHPALFIVVQVLYLAALLPMLGTPTRLGILPRDSRQSLLQLIAAVAIVVVVPTAAVTGPWWTPLVAGPVVMVAVVLHGRWRPASIRADLQRPPAAGGGGGWFGVPVEPSLPLYLALAIAAAAGVLALATGNIVLGTVGWLVYFLCMMVLVGIQQRIVTLLPEHRPRRVRAFPVVVGLIAGPVVPNLLPWSDSWWPAVASGLAAMAAVLVLGRWQLANWAGRLGPATAETDRLP